MLWLYEEGFFKEQEPLLCGSDEQGYETIENPKKQRLCQQEGIHFSTGKGELSTQ